MRPSPALASCAPRSLIPAKQLSFIRNLLLSQRKSQEGSLPAFLPHFITARASGSNPQLAAPVTFTASFSPVFVGDRNPTATGDRTTALSAWPSPLWPNHRHMNGRTTSMCIEDFFTMCERILRKAAEQNPAILCLQNIQDQDKAPDTNSQTKVRDFGRCAIPGETHEG